MQRKSNITNGLRAFTLIEIMIVVLIIGILLGIAVPNFVRAREQSRAKSCSSNLKQIDAAKQLWAMDKKIPSTDTTTIATLDDSNTTGIVGVSLYLKATPSCPSSGVYTIGNINTDPTCSASTTDFKHTINAQ